MFLAYLNSFGQSSITDITCTEILDKNGNLLGYIRKSKSKEYMHPKKRTKIFFYDENLQTLGYWYGLKRKFVPLRVSKEINIPIKGIS